MNCNSCGFDKIKTFSNTVLLVAKSCLSKPPPLTTTIYFHSDKESMCEIGEEFGLGMDALETFIYAGYDIGLRVVVYPKTGKTMCIGLDHDGEVVHLEEPVPI